MTRKTDNGAFTVKEFCAWAGIGRTTFYALVASGRLRVRKLGKKKTLILAREAVEWLESLPSDGTGPR